MHVYAFNSLCRWLCWVRYPLFPVLANQIIAHTTDYCLKEMLHMFFHSPCSKCTSVVSHLSGWHPSLKALTFALWAILTHLTTSAHMHRALHFRVWIVTQNSNCLVFFIETGFKTRLSKPKSAARLYLFLSFPKSLKETCLVCRLFPRPFAPSCMLKITAGSVQQLCNTYPDSSA